MADDIIGVDLVETTVPRLITKYENNKRYNHEYNVNLVDQADSPFTLKFVVNKHVVILSFENTQIKNKKDLEKALNDGDVNIDCDCADMKYRFSYFSMANGYGLSKEHRKPEKQILLIHLAQLVNMWRVY